MRARPGRDRDVHGHVLTFCQRGLQIGSHAPHGSFQSEPPAMFGASGSRLLWEIPVWIQGISASESRYVDIQVQAPRSTSPCMNMAVVVPGLS